MGPKKCLTEVLDISDYISQMECDSEEEAEERVENIEELISKVASYEEEHEDATLSELLEDIALVADIDEVDDNAERTLLMTIHSAKGLEFKNVFLIGMEDGLFPSYMSITGGEAEIEEERRLAYVAITRAKERLTISCAKARMIHGETQMNPVSRFVNEIPKKLFDIAPVQTRTYDTGYYDSDTSSSGGYRRFDSYRDDEITSSTYGSVIHNLRPVMPPYRFLHKTTDIHQLRCETPALSLIPFHSQTLPDLGYPLSAREAGVTENLSLRSL